MNRNKENRSHRDQKSEKKPFCCLQTFIPPARCKHSDQLVVWSEEGAFVITITISMTIVIIFIMMTMMMMMMTITIRGILPC